MAKQQLKIERAPILYIREVAVSLSVHRDTIRNWLKRGALKGRQFFHGSGPIHIWEDEIKRVLVGYEPAVHYLRVSAAAQQLGIHRKTLLRWIEEERLDALKLPGGHLRISDKEVARLRKKSV